MKPLASILLLALALTPRVALADNHITAADIELGDDAWVLALDAEAPLDAPRIRTERGYVRVWFPNLSPVRIDRDGDGDAVREVRLRAGYGDTVVAIVRVGDGRVVDEGAVTVARDGSTARIRIARDALPEVPAPVASPEAVTEAAAGSEAAAATEAAPEAASDAEPEATPEAENENVGRTPLSLTRSASGAAAPLPAPDGPSSVVVLLGLVLLLGLVYLAIRVFGRRSKKARAPIEIVAQKRLGARQQLIVVRALGEDHLIAVQGGRTERIASVPAPAADADDEGGDEGIEDLLPFLKLGPFARNRAGAADDDTPTTLHRERAPSSSEAPRSREDRPRFGAELMRLVAERGVADRVTLGVSARPPTSEAVAGLLRLREKAGR